MIISLILSVGLQIDTLRASSVTADFVSREVPSQVLRGTELQALSTTTVADALKFFAGVQIKDYGGLGGQKTINVRSLGTQHTGVYLDGVRITNCQNGTVDLGKYSMSNMEAIEVYNSNKVSHFMTASEYASGATLYLTTKKPTENAFVVNASLGSFHTYKADVSYSRKDLLFADVEVQHSRGDYPFTYKSSVEDTVGRRKNSDISTFRAELSGLYKHLNYHAYVYSSERGIPGGIVRRVTDQYGDVGRESDINSFLQCSYTNSWSAHSLKVNSRVAYDYLHYNSDFPENMFVHCNNHYHQKDAFLASVYSFRYNGLSVSASSDFRWSDLVCDVKGLQYLYRLDSKSSLSLFYDYRGLSVSSTLLYTYVHDVSKMPTADPLSRFTPSLNLSYQWGNLSVRAFYKDIFRAPTLNDLYYTQVGKRDLKPELARQVDFGASYSNQFLSIQCDYYHNDVKDKIVCLPQGGSYQWKMANYGRVVTDGVDLVTKVSYRNLSLTVSGTWQDVRDLTDPEEDSYNHKFLYSPDLSISSVLSYSVKKFNISLAHMYCSKRWWTYVEGDVLPPYHNFDLKAQYEFKKVVLVGECRNLFDNHYDLINRWPLPGRQIVASIKITL